MKRLIRLALITAVLGLAIAGAAVCGEHFVDAGPNFAVDVPDNWTIQETEDAAAFAGPDGIAQANVSIQAIKGVTLAQFANAFPSVMKQQLTKFKLISSSKTKLAGLAACLWIYTAKVEGVELKFKNYVVFKKGTMCNVVFATTTSRFKTDVTGFDAMVKTWSWAN